MDPDQELEMLRRLREKLGVPDKRDERAELDRLFGPRQEGQEAKLRAALSQDKPGAGHQAVINIPRLAFDGRGLGSIADLPAFVDGPVPGDTVRVEVVEADGSTYQCRLLETVSRASDRIRPACGVFGQCGGCHLLCLSYPAQLRVKERMVGDVCRHAGQREAEVRSVLPSPEALGYLTRITFDLPGGRPAVATLPNRQPREAPVSIDACPLCEPGINQVIAAVPDLFRAGKTPKSGARVTLAGTGESPELLLTVRGEGALDPGQLLKDAQQLQLPVAGVTHVRRGRRRSAGAVHLDVILGDEKHAVTADRFYPSNKYLVRQLREQMIRLASPTGRDRVLLTGAAAAFTFPAFHKLAGSVLIADSQSVAESAGAPSALVLNAPPGELFQHPAILALPRKEPSLVVHALEEGPDCAPFINALSRQQIEKVLIVSWDLQQFARCLQVLAGGGYRTRVIQPLDLWPNTRRVLVLAFLTHPQAGPSILMDGWQDLR